MPLPARRWKRRTGRNVANLNPVGVETHHREVKVAKPRIAKPTNGAVFSPKITLKNGRVIYAADYGLKAFCFSPRSPKPKR